jgi:hypothetical protein
MVEKNAMQRCAVLILAGMGFVPFLSAQTTIEEHWSPYAWPRTIDEGVRFHLIAKGDTLWDIANHYFNNPLLWPQLYQANSYIKDPDLIYPGDPVVLEIGVVISGPETAQDMADAGASDDSLTELTEFAEGQEQAAQDGSTVSDRTQTTSMLGSDSELIILPAGDRTDIECSTYIYPMRDSDDKLPFSVRIVGGEAEHKLSFGIDDVVFLDRGQRDGLKAGDHFSVRHPMELVYSPHPPRKLLGRAIDQVGRVRVIAVQEATATGIVIDACDRVTKDDYLVPFEQEPIPLITELPPFDRWESFDTSGGGSIVYCEDKTFHVGIGNIINASVGLEQNVAPGDIFIIYRPNPHRRKDKVLPPIYLGQAVALKSTERTSVLKIIEGVDVMHIGDMVVPYR